MPRPFTLLLCLLAASGWLWLGKMWLSKPSHHGEKPLGSAHSETIVSGSGTPEVSDQSANRQGPIPPPAGTNSSVRGSALADTPAYLGIRGERFKKGNVSGVRIIEVFPGSPAALAGLRSEYDPLRVAGDLIVKANDRFVRSEDDLRGLLKSSVPGDEIKLLVSSVAGDSYQLIPIILGAAPSAFSGEVQAQSQNENSSQSLSNPFSKVEEEIFNQVNRVRLEHGLDPLAANPQLAKVARQHSTQMASLNFFSHISPDGHDVVDRLQAEGIEGFKGAGENIFMGEDATNLQRSVEQSWLTSPGHRRNMLSSNFQETGVGVATGDKRKVYITQVFLQRRE